VKMVPDVQNYRQFHRKAGGAATAAAPSQQCRLSLFGACDIIIRTHGTFAERAFYEPIALRDERWKAKQTPGQAVGVQA